MDLIVSTQWLADHLADPDLVLIDASWHMPATGRNGAVEFEAGHIPGAGFFDLDGVSDHSTSLPHMLPSSEDFAAAMSALGLSNDSKAVIYDGAGLFSAPRLWWMLRVFGFERAAILDGGFPAWKAEGRPIETGPARQRQAPFSARLNKALVADLDQVRQALAARSHKVLDARSADRFYGRAPEPRPGLASGHMPGASNLPSTDLVAQGRLKDPASLKQALNALGIDGETPVITSCGSGVSAAIITLAMVRVGLPIGALYDGSWTEWGGNPALPVATS
jgi:thiosulfate/3-mercaptopyruvate sulfurtransferase